MVFEEPKVEVVEIEQTDIVCESGSPSLETCDGNDAPSNKCSGFMM